MPIHDWKPHYEWVFRSFHLTWLIRINEVLNATLPKGYYPLLTPDSSKLEGVDQASEDEDSDDDLYSRRTKDVLAIRDAETDLVISVIELITPNDKANVTNLQRVLDRVCEVLGRGVHVLVVDVHPPTTAAPGSIHSLIWQRVRKSDAAIQAERTRAATSYCCGNAGIDAFLEPLAFGDRIPNMPLFMRAGEHVLVPFEETYQSAWNALPLDCREQVESGME